MAFNRNFIYSLVALILTTAPMMAQCPPSGYPQPGNTCAQAPLICQNLNGYCATINNNNTAQSFPGCPGWTLNNDEWLAFFAGATSISLQITPSNCSSNNNQFGLQGGIYAACGPPWVIMDLQCSCTQNSFILESGNFIVGEIYYLILDGCAGSICDYSIQVLSGSTVGFPPGNPGPVSGPAIACQTSTDYSVDSVAGSTSYNWALNPSNAGTINGNGNSSITINWSGNITGPVELCVTCSNACFTNSTPSCRTIEVFSPVLIEQTTTPVTCPGGADGVVALNVSGGTMPYSYQWNNGQTTATATGLVAGAYTATVIDNAGCTATISATVTQPDVLTIAKTITNVSPPGGSDGSVALSVAGGTTPYLYLWSNGQTTATATGLAAGTYTATVTDNKGCTATTSAMVTQPIPTLLAVSATTIRIKYYNTIAPATATAANLRIWGDETGLRTGTYSVSADTVTFVANTAFRAGELIHITSKSSLQFTGGGATIPFSWVRQSVVTNPTTPVFDTTGTGIILPSAAYSANASYDATTADVNRDGLQDVVFRYHASYGAATNILVYLRNTDGTFATPATYTNPESHSGLVGTPDLNSDGYPDIVLFHNLPSRIHVRLNDGSGGFGANTLYLVTNYCNGAKVYDMDNDGDLDIVAFAGNAGLTQNTVSVLKNNGAGTFAAQVTTNTSVFGTSCQPVDLDNDGDMDLAYTSNNAYSSSRVFRVYRNDGTGMLALNNSEANNSSKQVLSAFDYNGDGNADLITFIPNGEIYLGNAGINYTLAAPSAFTADYAYTLSGDLDGDGDLDIFNPNSSNGTTWNALPLKVFLNDGSGIFATTTTSLVLPLLWRTDLFDYDSDGDLDHIYLDPATGEIKVLLNGAIIPLTTITNVNCPGEATGTIALSVSGGTSPYTYLWSNNQTTATAIGLVTGTYTVTVTDSNGSTATTSATVTEPAALSITKTITNVSPPGGSDGSVALSVTGGTTPYLYLWSNGQTTATATGLAAGTYTATVTDNKGCTATTSAMVMQLTPTLLVVSANTIRIKYYNMIAPATATAANLPIWGDETGLRTGTYSVSADTVTFVANTAFRAGELIHITSKSSLQFTGGGATIPFSWVRQSVVTNPTTPVFDTTGTGIILPSAAYSAVASYNAALADVNRDGQQDMVYRYLASGGAATNILVYLRNANGTFAAPATYTNSESYSVLVGTPDVNNDGYPDIVLFHNVPSRIQVRLNNGSGGFGAAALYTVTNFCNGAKVYDMDNDGDLDIIAYAGNSSLSSNTISVLKNNGNGTFAAQVTTNTSVFGTTCQPADLDNDGDMDLAYTSNNAFGSSRVFRVYRNDGTGALTLNNSEANNLSKQVMSAFDYNGDNNVDLITSAPNGEIYLNNADINYTLATPTAFTADYANTLPGDLDGDGDLDIFNANSYNGTSWNTLPLKYFLNNGSGTFTTTITALVLPALWMTDLSDYDSDGDLDHIYLNPATGEIKVLLNGNVPVCTNLTAPASGAVNVPVTATLSWPAVSLVTGYRLSIGTTPGGTQILNNYDVGNVTTYDPPGNLPYNATIYVTITPYNTAGNAAGCIEESFETEVSLLLTTGGIPAATLVTNHLIGGGCFEVSNITSAGVAASRGTFSGGAPNINIASGVVLCTGNVSVLTGPNNANNASGNTAGFTLNSTDDPDLATLSVGNQFDLSRIEFDFKPTTSSIQFEFVFGSEEYCEYVSSQYNDVFGIFISGPGINGTQNIALVPNTNTPVTINNVNALVNPAYYVNNNNWPGTNCSGLPMAAPEACQLDGWTGVLTATATVVPCATYHIKLAIADIADGSFASAVFVRMHTLTNSGYANATAIYPAGQQYVTEGCNDGFIRFTRTGGDLDMPLPVPFSIGGSATPGIDYEPLPDTATIPAGATETLVPVTTYADLLVETQETIAITLNAPCSCATATTNFLINNKPPLSIDMDDQVQCGLSSIILTPDILSAGLPPLTYAWSTGATTASIVITTPGTNIYTVTVTDDCGSTATAAASVTLTPLPNNFSILQTITPVACAGGANGAVALNVSGGAAPYTYLWNNGQMAATATSLIANTYTVTLTDSQGCSATVSATVTQPAALSIAKTITNVSCPNGSNGAVALSITGGTTPYSYLWNNGQTTATATGLIAGTYTVTATDAHGCTATTTATVTQPTTNPSPADLCQNACVFCTINGYAGSTAGYTGQTPPGFCGTAENEQWMGFVAETASLTITATPSDCQNGNGVQIALYTGCNGTLVACNLGQNSGGNTPVSITVNVTPGETYFLLLDGWAGDICNFTLQVTPAPTPAPVQAAVKVFLQGPYVSSVQLMHDSLRVKNLIPLTEPYTGLTNFTHVGSGGGEQTTAAVRAVTGPNAIVDWVFLELRNPDTPAQVVATRSALVQRDGDVVDVDGVSPVAFGAPADREYYLTVRHRNHLGVQLGAELPFAGCLSTEKDFTLLPPEGFYAHNGLSPAQRLISGRYALWAGNGRIDPQLKYNGSNNDRTTILSVVGLSTPNAVVSGYRLQDYNLDGVVKYNGAANDRNLLLGNVGITTPSAVVEDQVAR